MGKANASLIIRGIRQCLTMGTGDGPLTGEALGDPGLVEDAAVAADGDRIVYVGPASGLLTQVREAPDAVRIDAGQGVVMPGFVDPHTHLLFGGWRPAEFAQRIEGASYQQILAAGGGILSTVERTRQTSEEDLVVLGRRRLRRMLEMGTTTVEAKSGYGLSLEAESKLVRAACRLAATEVVDVVCTLLGAHALPPEFRDDRSGYIKLVRGMIDTLGDRVDFVDAFCEEGAFTVAECREIFTAAERAGLRAKLHADQLGDTGGAKLAAEVGAVSADHLDYVSQAGGDALAAAGTVAVLLPTVPMYLMSRRQAPAGRLRDQGVALALATDFNPGTSPVESMGVVVSVACMLLRMTPAEALVAATRNAAAAIGRASDVGSLQTGRRADLQLYEIDDYRMLPYRFGQLRPRLVVKNGEVVVDTAPAA